MNPRSARGPARLADGGERSTDDRGFTKEPDDGKPDLSWLFTVDGLELVPRELIERIAAHYAAGAKKYAADNWRSGTSDASIARFRRSLTRHFFQFMRGERDEDHAAAIMWNVITLEINGEINAREHEDMDEQFEIEP